MSVSNKTHTKEQLDDYSEQLNPNNEKHKVALDRRSDQLNPNNDEYWQSRGLKKPKKKT
ncbi:MAG: hypothetical protein FWG66_12385 [Spirochaetes bacterium]|nr:hypothetical protein [Spirochaetota bacterium]